MHEDLPEAVLPRNGQILIASVRGETREFLDSELEKAFPGINRGEIIQFSQMPPAWIGIVLGSIGGMLGVKFLLDITLKPFLTKFFETLGEKSGENFYEYMANLKRDLPKDVETAKSLVEIWKEAQAIEGREIGLRISLPDGDNPHGAHYHIQAGTPDEIEGQLILMMALWPAMSRSIEALREQGENPLGWFRVTPNNRGYVIAWTTQDDMTERRTLWTFDGAPLD